MLLYSSNFTVDSVFEGEMKHRINFGQPYLGIIWNQREHRQLLRVKFSDIQDLNYSCKWYEIAFHFRIP